MISPLDQMVGWVSVFGSATEYPYSLYGLFVFIDFVFLGLIEVIKRTEILASMVLNLKIRKEFID